MSILCRTGVLVFWHVVTASALQLSPTQAPSLLRSHPRAAVVASEAEGQVRHGDNSITVPRVNGKLGISLNDENVVLQLWTAEAENVLEVGDLILEVDGQVLGRRRVVDVLKEPKPKHTFKVARSAESLPLPAEGPSRESMDAEPDPEAVALLATLQEAETVPAAAALTVTEHYKLAQVDVSQNMDKFYVVQTLSCGEKHLFVSRWGRTGTKGQGKVEGPFDTAAAATALLNAKFREKTDNTVASVADGTFTAVDGMYDLLRGDAAATRRSMDDLTTNKDKGCLWQYYVDDGVDGKKTGWYDYYRDAAAIVEGVFSEWQRNPRDGLSVRCVQSGQYCYHVDFNLMQQTNINHCNRKQRKIRRNA